MACYEFVNFVLKYFPQTLSFFFYFLRKNFIHSSEKTKQKKKKENPLHPFKYLCLKVRNPLTTTKTEQRTVA